MVWMMMHIWCIYDLYIWCIYDLYMMYTWLYMIYMIGSNKTLGCIPKMVYPFPISEMVNPHPTGRWQLDAQVTIGIKTKNGLSFGWFGCSIWGNLEYRTHIYIYTYHMLLIILWIIVLVPNYVYIYIYISHCISYFEITMQVRFRGKTVPLEVSAARLVLIMGM